MAQECFCGCGHQISGFMSRGMNKQGRRTLELTDRLRSGTSAIAERGPIEEGGDVGPLVEMLENYAQEGDSYAEFWQGCVHGTVVPPPGEAREVKRAWVAWGKNARRVAGLAELPPETLREVIARSSEP